MYEFLSLIEDGTLHFTEDTATSEELCIVAVGYHNLAIVQLKMEASDLACKSILNARKIARLCLSYSNRWLANFQWTFDVCVEDVKFQVATKFGGAGSLANNLDDKEYWGLSQHQYEVLTELITSFYDPHADEKTYDEKTGEAVIADTGDVRPPKSNIYSRSGLKNSNYTSDSSVTTRVCTKPRPIYV
jgi:hypothetical protein